MNSNTVIDQLSGLFTSALTALQSPEFLSVRHDLTSLTHTVTSLEQEVTASLSSIPIHPYERLKYDYFGTDYTFKTLDDLEEPEDIPFEKCIDVLKEKNKDLMSTSFHNLTCCDEEKCMTAFSYTSCDCILPDHEKQKNYIEYVEIVRSIPLDSINADNYLSIAKKLIGQYFKVI
jgi:hypothetical protein